MEQGVAGPPAMLVPDLIEPVIGYRQWRVRDAELRSVFADARWTRGLNTARCVAPGAIHAEAAPASACSCGLYAWYRPCPRLASAATADLVDGAVAMWGTIELHATGMRAQHAIVVALALPLPAGGKRRRMVDVARALEVPAVPARRLAETALAFGRPIDRTLVPRSAPPALPAR
jgi:hypothetical protein